METDNLIPLSYVSQYNYCKRRVGLLMIEQLWNENSDTAKGRIEHENVHSASVHYKNQIAIISDLHVVSKKMNLIGKCDSVEAYVSEEGCIVPFLDDRKYVLYPIEYKHGSIRDEHEYKLQLCAQAMCLEEMYGCKIEKGALFYISSHKRCEVIFSRDMREAVNDTALQLSKMLESGIVCPPKSSAKCNKCSMKDICMPNVAGSAKKYMNKIYSDFSKEDML
jgi:CRISPR-associated exonuclease Cas4